MKNGRKGATLVSAVLMLAGSASAAEPVGAAPNTAESGAEVRPDAERVTLASKLRLVKLLLDASPAVKRIPQSSNAQAKKKLADAQVFFAKAESESKAGRGDAAIQLLDEALREIVSASRLVPDAAQLAAQERTRNTELRESIRNFQLLHKNASNRAAKKAQAPAAAADLGRLDGMVEKADALIAAGNQHEANLLLNDAYKIAVAALNKMLTSETLVYSLKFDTPAEEFQYELARNRSYEELIPIALAQLNTKPETATLAERYVQQSRDLRDAAQKQAGSGDYPAALKNIQDATSHLQRSLRIAGVVVPQSPEIKP